MTARTVPARSGSCQGVDGRPDPGELVVTIAGIQDRDGAVRPRAALRATFSTIVPDLGRRRLRRTPGALGAAGARPHRQPRRADRKSTRLNSSHANISY